MNKIIIDCNEEFEDGKLVFTPSTKYHPNFDEWKENLSHLVDW
jgi:hypothetical protein